MNLKSLPLRLVAAASVLLTNCRKNPVDTVWWGAEQERIELAQRLALKEFRLTLPDGGTAEEWGGLERRNREVAGALESLSARRNNLLEKIESMEAGMVAMRENFLLSRRGAVTGKAFDRFNAWNGRAYQEVFISSVDDGGVTMRHAGGSVRLRYDALNDAQREMFGLDAERAQAAMTQERVDAAEYDRWVERRLVEIREEERLAATADLASRTRTAARSERSVVAANVSPLARTAVEFSSRDSGYPRRYYRYRPSYRYHDSPIPVYRNACVPNISYLNRLPKVGKRNPHTITRLPILR